MSAARPLFPQEQTFVGRIERPFRAMCGRLRVGKDFLHARSWSVQPCVRPVCSVHMTAGQNALRYVAGTVNAVHLKQTWRYRDRSS
jgi:hypothetical protein